MTDHTVLIVGAGPAGMMLAGELALAGIDVAILERRPTADLVGQRAGGLHARTIEIFDQRGIADRFLAAGKIAQVAGFAGVPLDISDFPTRHPYGLGLWQTGIERILGEWIGGLGVTIERGCEVVGLAQDDTGVAVELADGRRLHADYLVGADGGRSIVRKLACIDFPGAEATTSNIIAEAEFTGEAEWGVRRDAIGIHGLSKLDNGHARILVTERKTGATTDPTLEDLRRELVAVYGTDYGLHSPVWISRFTDAIRQAATYRAGRVLICGDAAHVHPPDGGQGLQLGIHDAVNLGWKLAQVLKGISPEALLDTYQTERHPVTARVLQTAAASVAMRRADEPTTALRSMLGEMLAMDEPRKHLAGLLSGLGIRYDLGEGHKLLGRRMPDLDITTGAQATRVYALLHDAKPLLLTFGAPGSIDVGSWSGRVQLVDATTNGPWDLPVIGIVPAPSAVLIRPDGYVAWVGEGSTVGLEDALVRWFGAA